MFSRLATVLQELSGEEAPDGEPQVRTQYKNTPYSTKTTHIQPENVKVMVTACGVFDI